MEGVFYYLLHQFVPIEKRICPNCNSRRIHVHGHFTIRLNVTLQTNFKEVIQVVMVRFVCLDCHKTFSFELTGRYGHTSSTTVNSFYLKNDFKEKLTFSQISKKYGVSIPTIINRFDEFYPFVKRGKLTQRICVDEIYYPLEYTKYVTIIYDFDSGKIIDLLPGKTIKLLFSYFSAIPLKERSIVKHFISDLYDGYFAVHNEFFSQSIHVADLFHVAELFTNTIDKLRNHSRKQLFGDDTIEGQFMRCRGKTFLKRLSKGTINRIYRCPINDQEDTYWNIMTSIFKEDRPLMEMYYDYQDFLNRKEIITFTNACKYIERWVSKVDIVNYVPEIKTFQNTLIKYKVSIANGLATNQKDFRYTNAIAEETNRKIKDLIRISYGFMNADRLRRRLLVLHGFSN